MSNYLITEVSEDKNGVIKKVKDNKQKVYTKVQIVDFISQGHVVETYYKPAGKTNYQVGSAVKVIISNGIKYIRSDSNKIAKDNLDNLPKF